MQIKPRIILLCYSILPALIALGLLVSLPNDGQNAFLFGLSKSRFIVAVTLFLAAITFAFLTAFFYKQADKSLEWLKDKLDQKKIRDLFVISGGIIFFVAFTFLNIPEKYLGGFLTLEERIRPLETWFLLVSLQGLLGMLGLQVAGQKGDFPLSKKNFILLVSIFGIMVLMWMFIAITGLGVTGANSYWSKIGVPVLWPQIALALGFGLGLKLVVDRFKVSIKTQFWPDMILISMLWLTAVLLWNHQSYVQGVFNTQPRPPTYEVYPINDSLIFDVDAQNLLIGKKMVQIDKPIYISFLAILHFLAGASYTQFYLFQIMVFSFIPIVCYFIGKNLHSRPLGLFFAILLLIKELNAIALTNYIQVSTSKMILSEMLTSLGVLLFTLFILKWHSSSDPGNFNLMIAGGILGITSLIRLNSIGILPIVILMLAMALNFKWKKWVLSSMLLSVFVGISLAPWIYRNTVVSGNPFSFVYSKTTGVIRNERYTPIINSNPSSQTNNSNNSQYLVIGTGIVTNFLHNLIGITLMLPPSIELYDQVNLVRLPYWKLDWNGSLDPGGFLIIIGVLVITSMGIKSVWKRLGVVGLLPVGVILGYDITTSLALTSGGRYLVPMDWGVLLYFSIGLWEAATGFFILFGWFRHPEPEAPLSLTEVKPWNSRQILIIGLFFLFLGAIPLLLENLPKRIYPATVALTDFASANRSIAEFSFTGNGNKLSLLLNNPEIVAGYGKALYPRYFGENKGEGLTIDQDPLIGSTGFDRLTFLLIGGKDTVAILLPTTKNISPLIQEADTWVVGCRRSNYIEAIIVVFRQNNTVKTYWSDPFKSNCQ